MGIRETMRKRATSLVLALLMAVGCTFNTAAVGSQGSSVTDSNHSIDSSAADVQDSDSGIKLKMSSLVSSALGAAAGYNFVCFGDFGCPDGETYGGADVLGKSFIGGKINWPGGFTFGSKEIEYGLVFASTVKENFEASTRSPNCKALVYNSEIEDDIKSTKYNFTGYDHWKSVNNLKSETGIDLALSDTVLYENKVSVFQEEMMCKSQYLAHFKATGKIYFNSDSKNLMLKGTKTNVNLFTINGNDVDGKGTALKDICAFYIDIPSGSTAIFNITGSDVGLPSGGTKSAVIADDGSFTGESDFAHGSSQQKLLWNFSEAETLEFKGGVNGSVLAPKANLTAVCQGNFEGELIVNSAVFGANFEGHNYPFKGKFPDEVPPTLKKTAELVSWDDRTYNITVSASSAEEAAAEPADVVLVLDKSGSMPWLVTQPKVSREYNSEIPSGGLDIAKTDNDPGRYNYTYYIRTDDEYKPIGYVTDALIGNDKAYARGFFSENGWYLIQSDGNGQKMIYDKVTGGTVYVRGSEDKTKLEMLQEATSTFTENFANTNDKSKIAVVGFSNTITYHDFVDASDADDIQKFIADPQEMAITGGTDMVGGLNEAQILLSGIAVKNDGNKKYVVLFSDGNPDSDPGSKASEIKADGTAIYTVGIYGGSVDVNECESMMKSAATDNSYYINANQSEDGLLGAFESIFNSITSSESAIVTDYIDPRFEVINTAGGVLREDEHGSYVEWNAVIGAADGEKAGWAKTITVKAKDEFIGGNNITTNIAPYSGVTYGSSSKFLAFPNQPAVNVKPRFYVGNAEVTIFRGEKVPPCTLEPYTLKSDGITKVTGTEMYIKESEVTGTFTYQWNKADGSPLSNTQEFPPNQYPDDDTHYTLIASFDPDASTDESKNNSDGHVAGETESCKGIKNLAKAEGIYTVNVIKGELDIIKNMVGKYPAPDEVAAHQGFVFKIERSDTKGGAAVDTFYEVITPDAGKIKKITGLKKGYYKITEETGKGTGAWRYEQGSAIDNDVVSIGGYTSTNDDQLVYIGRETTESGAAVKSYFGSDGKNLHGVLANPAAIVFTNILNDKHWLGDTTVAVNTVTN